MTISMVYTRGEYHIIFNKSTASHKNGAINYLNGIPYSVPSKVVTVEVIEAIAPYWLVTRLSSLDTWRECSDDKIHVLLGNPSRFIMNLIREGFRKDLSLIPVYETMQELVS